MIIKLVLLAAALLVGVLVLRERIPGQHLAVRRLVGMLVVLLGIVAVLWPNITTIVANAIGVGRGTDLVLYVLVVVFVYSTVATTQRLHRVEHQVTELARRLALLTASQPELPENAPAPADRSGPPAA